MPAKKGSKETALMVRLSGLFLRRKSDREFHSYIPLLDYNPNDYEVLLRMWGSEPFPRHLGAFSGPVIAGEDPQETLLTKSIGWTKDLANKAEISNYKPMKCHKALFLSIHGGERPSDVVSKAPTPLGVVLCYILPIKQSNSSLVSLFPDLPLYPKFYNLGDIQHQMVRGNVKIHPYTREMLSTLDHWLREQHAVAGGINTLFAPSLESRLKMFVANPMFTDGGLQADTAQETPNQSFTEGIEARVTSTPFSGLGDESARHEVATPRILSVNSQEYQPVDMIVENPVFGSGLRLKKVDMFVPNEYFFCGEPNYKALKDNKGEWALKAASDGLPDWTEMFPLHKFCCEGNVERVKQCIKMGMSVDERDTDTWTPLHYACWYGELEVVKALIEGTSVNIGIQNSSGSTPLHLAAGTGHAAVVAYLLKQRGGQVVKAALDDEGKSPLAVCLDCKSNNWKKTAQILRDAYSSTTPADPSFPPLPYSPSLPAMEDLALIASDISDEQLGHKGGQGDIHDRAKSPKKARQNPEKKPSKTIRRQRVNLGIGRHQVAHFFNGRETNCKDIIINLYKLIKLPRNFHTLFALYIASNSLELQMGDTDQPLKLIYAWKKMLSQYGPSSAVGKGEGELPTLYLWRNVFFPPASEQSITDPMALEFLYTDAHRHILKSHYPCSENDAFILAGITLQILYGDYNEEVHGSGFLKDKLASVLPSHMIASRRKVEYERKVLAKYAEMSQFGFVDMKFLYQSYLKHCWQWPYYGATFYEGVLHLKETKLEIKGKIPRKSQLSVLVGINTNGFHLINIETHTLLASVSLDGLDWDVSSAKQEMVVFNENKTTYILIHSRKVSLLYGVATRMREQHTQA